MSSNKYVNLAVQRVEAVLKEKKQKLPTKALTPLSTGYRPELDISEELKDKDITSYQEYISMLRWVVEIGRINIMVEVSMMLSHLACPREGHLKEVLRIFAYLKAYPKRTLAFNPRQPPIDQRRFIAHDWYDFYKDAVEAIPEKLPPPVGKSVSIHCFVDASHADNQANRQSQTGILIFLNRAPIIWYSKKQKTVKTATFGSKIIAMQIAVEVIQGLRFKLRTFGVPIEGPADVFCDNKAVTKAARNPESTLAKKHNSVAYHKVRESVAMKMIRVAWEDTKYNLANLLTKVKARVDRERLIDRFMY